MFRLAMTFCVCLAFASPALAQGPTQHGDVAIGYVLVHETGLTLPVGFAVSDGYRLGKSVDLVIESQFAHGNANLLVATVGVNLWSAMGGVRFSGGSRYGDKVREFGQVLAGVVRVTGTLGSVASSSTAGFGVQPGFGFDIPLNKTVALRPQVDTIFSHTAGSWGTDTRVAISAVFRLYR